MTKDTIIEAAIMIFASVAIATPFACGPRPTRHEPPAATAGMSLADAEAILAAVMPSPEPTPFPRAFVLDVTIAGNVALPGQPYMLIVAGKCPIELVPPRCREDYRRLPRGATLACMRTDDIHRRLRPDLHDIVDPPGPARPP